MASSGIIHATFLPAHDIPYWCEEGLIAADRLLMFSQSRQGGGRDEGGKVEEEWRREEGIWVDWHRGKLKLTSGNEQPYTSFLLLPQKTFCVCHAQLSSPPADERSDMWRQTYNQVYKFPVVQWDVLTGNARIMYVKRKKADHTDTLGILTPTETNKAPILSSTVIN